MIGPMWLAVRIVEQRKANGVMYCSACFPRRDSDVRWRPVPEGAQMHRIVDMELTGYGHWLCDDHAKRWLRVRKATKEETG